MKLNKIGSGIKIKMEVHKIKNGSSFKKPLYISDIFGNYIKKEIQ